MTIKGLNNSGARVVVSVYVMTTFRSGLLMDTAEKLDNTHANQTNTNFGYLKV